MDPLLQRRRTPKVKSVAGDSHSDTKKKKPILRFIGTGFRYNTQVALALAPGLLSFILFGGPPVLGIIFCILFVVYLLDLFDKPHAIFMAIWFGLGVINIVMFGRGIALVQASFVNIFLLGLFSLSVLMIACWVSLQFKWLQDTSSNAMILMERVLFTLSPLIFSVIMTYASGELIDIIHGPFVMLASICYIHYILNQPRPSCFRPSETQLINNSFEMAVHSISIIALPVLFHFGLFHRNFFIMYHLVNLLAVICFAIIFLHLTERHKILIDFGVRFDTAKVSRFAFTAAISILVFCFEYRVIFVSFYNSIPIPAPFSHLFITIGCYSAAGMGYLFIIGEAKRIGRTACTIVASICAFTIGCAIGMGIFTIPIIIGAAIFLTSFYFTRKALDYILFSILSSLLVLWFIVRSYWFLEFDFEGVSLQIVCLLILLVTVVSLCIPANIFAPQRGPIFAIYALCIFALESVVYFHPLDVYPFYVVAFTSIVGIALTLHLEKNRFIKGYTTWICLSAFISKLILAISISRENVIASFILLLAILAPYYLHSKSISKRTGIIYSVIYGILSFITSQPVGGTIMYVLLDRIPPPATLVGVFLLTWGLSCFGLSMFCFSENVMARRLSSTLALFGGLLLVVDPQLGLFATLGSNTPILFIIALVITLLCSQSRYQGMRIFFIIAMSIICSIMLVDTTLPTSITFYICFTLVFIPFFTILNWISFPSVWSDKALPIVYLLFLIMFMLTLFFGTMATKQFPPRTTSEYMRQLRSALIGLYGGLNIFLSLIIKMKISKSSNTTNVKTPFDHKWLAEIGNIATLLGYGVSCYFCLFALGHPEFSLFLLSPILLLLSTDKYLFRWLREENRYAPVVACCTIGLFSMAIYKMCYMALIRFKWKAMLIREFFCLICVIPTSYLFPRYLFDLQKQPIIWWIIIAPLNLVGLFASFTATYWLAVEGILLSIAYFIIMLLLNRQNGKNFI